MKVSNLILRTADLDRAVEFWTERVGLPLLGRHEAFAFLDAGSIQIALNAVDKPFTDDSMSEIVLEVDDIHAAHSEMKARGVPFEIEPRVVTGDASRTLLAAHFHDPDGHAASISGWVDGAPPEGV